MPYDPQRSHRRPQLADDAPAPIDALLDHAEAADVAEPEPAPAATAEAPVVTKPVAPAHEGFYDEPEVVAATERGRPRVALLVAALLVAVLVLAWVRRRR